MVGWTRMTPVEPGGSKLPLNTDVGGLSYMQYGICALQESARQMRGIAPIPGAAYRLPRPRSISSRRGAGGAGTAGFLMTDLVPSNLSILPSSASKRSSKV